MSDEADNKKLSQAKNIIAEIVSTEESFLKSMEAARNAWQGNYLHEPKLKIDSQKKEQILSTLNDACSTIQSFLHAIKNAHQSFLKDPRIENAGKFIHEYEHIYKDHTHRYSAALSKASLLNNPMLTTLVSNFEKKLQDKDPQHSAHIQATLGGKQSILDLLIQPVQRLPRHELLAKELSKAVPDANNQLSEMAKTSANLVNKSVGKNKVVYSAAADNLVNDFKSLIAEIKYNPKLKDKLNISSADLTKLELEINALQYKGNDPQALRLKAKCLEDTFNAYEGISRDIENISTKKESNIFKIFLIKIGILKAQAPENKEKYKNLFTHYKSVKENLEELRSSAHIEDAPMLKAYNRFATTQNKNPAPVAPEIEKEKYKPGK